MENKRKANLMRILGTSLVLALSLYLLAYVGYGEAQRTYPRLEMEKLAAQGDLVRNVISPFLLAGLPLEQFPGFEPLTATTLEADPSVGGIYITRGEAQEPLFLNTQAGLVESFDGFETSTLQGKDAALMIEENDLYYRVRMPLNDKFETVGYLNLVTSKSALNKIISDAYWYVWPAMILVVAIYAIVLLLSARRQEEKASGLGLVYTVTFVVSSIVVVFALMNLYLGGIQKKGAALSASLGQRINAPLALGLSLSDFTGIDSLFQSYRELNPDVGYIALTSQSGGQEVASIHTTPGLVGQAYATQASHIENQVMLVSPTGAASYTIHLGIPTSVIYRQMWRSVKNFVVLFVASAFLSSLFFNLINVLIRQQTTSVKDDPSLEQKLRLGVIQPFYFLVVFVEGLCASFLPQFLRDMAGSSEAQASVPTIFTLYFLGFLVALLPAGTIAERKGIRPLMLVGSILSVLSFVLITVVDNFALMFVVRFLAGLGQGILYIGVQSYILEVAKERRTEANSLIVFGYNGGMISGTAIGALLSIYMGETGVFTVGAVISFLFFVYAFYFIPHIKASVDEEKESFGKRLGQAVRDSSFVKAMLLIGIPAKAVLSGVTVFALPFILASFDYQKDDIGQILMLYAAGVLISSRFAARIVDRLGRADTVLFIGTVGSGFGLLLTGLVDWPGFASLGVPWLPTASLMVGLLLLGLSHGFVHAPIMTYVADTQAARALGKASASSLYRFLERLGHVSGPILIGWALTISGNSAIAISYIGMVILAFGILFAIRLPSRKPATNPA